MSALPKTHLSIPTELVKKDKKIAMYQLVGGAFGFLEVVWSLFTDDTIKGVYFIATTGFLLYSFSMVCGWACLKGWGQHYTLSMLNQSIQTVMFCFGSVYFRYCAGAYIVADVDVTNEIKLGANVGLSLLHIGNNADDEWQLSFNLVAIWLLVYIYRLRQTKASMA